MLNKIRIDPGPQLFVEVNPVRTSQGCGKVKCITGSAQLIQSKTAMLVPIIRMFQEKMISLVFSTSFACIA